MKEFVKHLVILGSNNNMMIEVLNLGKLMERTAIIRPYTLNCTGRYAKSTPDERTYMYNTRYI